MKPAAVPARASQPSAERATVAGIVVASILCLAAAAVVLAAVPSTLFDLDRFSVPKELVLHAAAFFTVLVILPRRQTFRLGIVEASLLAYCGWSILSTMFAHNWWLATRSVGITLSGTALFFAGRFAATQGARRIVLSGIAFAVLLGGLTGLAQTYGWSSALLADTRAPGGTLGNRNFMAHLMVLGLPLAGWLLARARTRLGVYVSLFLTSFAIAAIVLSRSRAAWVGLGAMVATVVLFGLVTRSAVPRLPRTRVLALGTAAAIGALGALILPNQLEWRSSTPYRDSLKGLLNYREGSGRGRLIQYHNSLELVRAHPILGTGPGNWAVEYPKVTSPNDPSFNAADPMPTNPWPSSDWIAIVAERGPVGVLLWLFVLVALGIIAARRTTDPDPATGAAALAAIGLIVVIAVEGMFDAVILLAPPTIVTMAGLGALLPPTRPVGVVNVNPSRHLGLTALIGLLFLALGGKSLGQLMSIRMADPGNPASRLERALRYDPGSYRLELLLAMRAGCPEARRHAEHAAQLFPDHPWPRRLRDRCGGG